MSEVTLSGESEKIWNEIKDIQLDLFGLPDQTIEKVCIPVDIEPSALYIQSNVGAVYAALEGALGKDFSIEMVGKFWVLNRKAA